MQTVSRVKCSPQVSTGESVERKPDASIHLAQQVSPQSLLLPDEQQFPVVLPVVSTKGGEGKSTKAGNIAGYTADAGLKTLLIDGDYNQPTASSIFKLHYEAPCGLYELLMQTADLNNPDSIISRTVIPNLDVIISNDPDDRLSNDMLHAVMAECVCVMSYSILFSDNMTS